MGDATNSTLAAPEIPKRLADVFAAQQVAFRADPCPSLAARRKKLKALRRQISRHQDVLAEAISRDFGTRSAVETKMFDLLGSALEASHAISHVRRWMKPSRRSTELLFLSNSLRVTYQPKGVVGIITPWNFPVYLALGPLIAALAAGNRAMIKMPETTPATNAALRRLLGEIFAEDEVALFGEEIADPGDFTALPFNHIVFTGSPRVGRLVMRAASANLTPVTLELGGKSPAVVMQGYSIAEAARRITHGKSINCGQICVSPDYALVPRDQVDAFVAASVAAFGMLYGERFRASDDYTSIVDDRHLARISDILTDAADRGATIVPCAPYTRAADKRRMPLHVVTGCTSDMRIMKEELFGPLLPVVAYGELEQAIAFVNAGERPLALYCFGHDTAARQRLLTHTHSGGVTINDWGWHVVNHDAPFGGVGDSGMGTYHGLEGFRELSHAKTVFKRHRFFPIGLFYPPYGNIVQHLALKIFLGSGDPCAGARQTSLQRKAA